MTDLTIYTVTLARVLGVGIRQRVSPHECEQDVGVSTLEMVMIALGLMAIAGILVAALTAAVTRRTNQIR